jgi:antitoxin component of RelBE/YafQ-DinJ toxin-antitoxin module
MDLTAYVESLRADLLQVADAGGADVRAAADRLSMALEPSVRMTLVNVLADAAAEITHDLPAGSVEVRMRGRDPELVVDTAQPAPSQVVTEETDEDGDVVARVTVRIPEALKTRAEATAAGMGQSLNSWIVQAIRAALRERAVHVDVDLSSRTLLGGRTTSSIQGWSR